MSVTEILEAVRALAPEEQQEVKALLDTLPTSTEPLMTESEFAEHLAAQGIVTSPEPMTEDDWREEESWQPVEVGGKPLSQIIIEERH